MRTIEQLSHSQRYRGLLSQDAEVSNIFWRQGILQEEQAKLFDIFAELNRLRRTDPLVYIVQQLDFPAHSLPDLFEHLKGTADIGCWLVDTTIM